MCSLRVAIVVLQSNDNHNIWTNSVVVSVLTAKSVCFVHVRKQTCHNIMLIGNK